MGFGAMSLRAGRRKHEDDERVRVVNWDSN